MPNPRPYNVRNKALSEANTKLLIASLKTGAKTITDLVIVTGLTRVTVAKKINQNKDLIAETETFPKRFYLKGVDYKTVIDEVVDKETARNPQTKLATTKAAIVNSSDVVFFPDKTHHDHSKFHDMLLSSEDKAPLVVLYQSIKSPEELSRAEYSIKTMYDLIQFRKTLKEF